MAAIQDDTVLIGVFYHRLQAEGAFQELRRDGFRDDQIRVALCDADLRLDGLADPDRQAQVDALAGLGVGAVLGGLLGALAAYLTISLLAAVVAAAATCAGVGGLLGALVGWILSAEEAAVPGPVVHLSRGVVTVRPEGRDEEAALILRRFAGCELQLGPPARGSW